MVLETVLRDLTSTLDGLFGFGSLYTKSWFDSWSFIWNPSSDQISWRLTHEWIGHNFWIWSVNRVSVALDWSENTRSLWPKLDVWTKWFLIDRCLIPRNTNIVLLSRHWFHRRSLSYRLSRFFANWLRLAPWSYSGSIDLCFFAPDFLQELGALILESSPSLPWSDGVRWHTSWHLSQRIEGVPLLYPVCVRLLEIIVEQL